MFFGVFPWKDKICVDTENYRYFQNIHSHRGSGEVEGVVWRPSCATGMKLIADSSCAKRNPLVESNSYNIERERPRALGCFDRIRGSSVQIPPGARPGLGTQSHYEAPGDLLVKHWYITVTNIGWVTLSSHPTNCLKLALGQAKTS